MRLRNSAKRSSKLRSSRMGAISGMASVPWLMRRGVPRWRDGRVASGLLQIEGIDQDVLTAVQDVGVVDLDQHHGPVLGGIHRDVHHLDARLPARQGVGDLVLDAGAGGRSEEHTSELQ